MAIWVFIRDTRKQHKSRKKDLKEHEALKTTIMPEAEKYLEFFNLARQNYIIYKVSNENPKVAVFLLENMRKTLSEKVTL